MIERYTRPEMARIWDFLGKIEIQARLQRAAEIAERK